MSDEKTGERQKLELQIAGLRRRRIAVGVSGLVACAAAAAAVALSWPAGGEQWPDGVAVAVAVAAGVTMGVAVAAGVTMGLAVAAGVAVAVTVAAGLGAGTGVTMAVAAGVGVAVGVYLSRCNSRLAEAAGALRDLDAIDRATQGVTTNEL